MAENIKRIWNYIGYKKSESADSDFVQEFDEIQKLLNCPESKQIFEDVKGQDITIFIGNTRSGKSTLVNYAIGNQLIGVKSEIRRNVFTVVKANNQEQGPLIGFESVSETTLPSVWSASKSGLSGKVVDAPGFEDNRGIPQDVANAFYISVIIQKAKSVKFVLTTDINDIMSHNISSFTTFIDKIHNVFTDTTILHGGIALVFSKAKYNEWYVNDICHLFQKQILDQNLLKAEKSLIKYFLDKNEYIAFFKMPVSEGPLCRANVDVSILDIIQNKLTGIPGKALSEVNPGISDKSKVFLFQSYANFCNDGKYDDLLQNVQEFFANKSTQMYDAESIEELTKMNETMLGLENKVLELFPQEDQPEFTFKNLLGKLTLLCNICGIQNQMDVSNITVYIQFVEFLDNILNLRNGEINAMKFHNTITEIKDIFDKTRKNSSLASSKIFLMIAEKEMTNMAERRTKEIQEEYEKNEKLTKEREEKNKAEMKIQLEKAQINADKIKEQFEIAEKLSREREEKNKAEMKIEFEKAQMNAAEIKERFEKAEILRIDTDEKHKQEMKIQHEKIEQQMILAEKQNEEIRKGHERAEKEMKEIEEKHKEKMKQMVEKIEALKIENEISAREQIENMGIFTKIGFEIGMAIDRKCCIC